MTTTTGGSSNNKLLRRGKRPAIVVGLALICTALLWVGALSLSHAIQRNPVFGEARGSESPLRGTAEVGRQTALARQFQSSGNDERKLARRPELKTTGGQLASARFSLLAEYPHDTAAFTQGLSYYGGYLYESTGLMGGKSTVRKVDPETGDVLQKVSLGKEHFGEGMVIVDDEIYSLTWRSKVGFVWDLQSFAKKRSFTFSTKTGQGWGITSDGIELIVSDGSSYLFFWDRQTMQETRRVEVRRQNGHPVTHLNELEFIKGYVYANVWFDDSIYKIDPASGVVIDRYNLSELYPSALRKQELRSREACLNGIAWDPDEDVLYITGKLWPRMYKVKLDDEAPTEGEDMEAILDGNNR